MLIKYMHVEYKMKTNKYQALGTGSKSEQNKIDTTSTHIHDHELFCLRSKMTGIN